MCRRVARMSDWVTLPADNYCLSVRDGTHDSPKPAVQGRKLITSRHIIGGRIDLKSTYLISNVDFEAINARSKVDQWDVLISMIGTVSCCFSTACPWSTFSRRKIKIWRRFSRASRISRWLNVLRAPTDFASSPARLRWRVRQRHLTAGSAKCWRWACIVCFLASYRRSIWDRQLRA